MRKMPILWPNRGQLGADWSVTTRGVRSAEQFASERTHEGRLPPFEGQLLTVVGINPKNVNSVIVHDEAGVESLLRPELVERALRHEQGQG